jgi:hypothetical protein
MSRAVDDMPLFAYRGAPGVKSDDATTLRAALDMAGRAHYLRAAVLSDMKANGPGTADQIARRIGESILAIRPRCSELRAAGFIRDSGVRSRNDSGKSAIVWCLAP